MNTTRANTTVVNVELDKVFEVLLDAAAYPSWVVGTKRLAWVEPEWPAPGSAFWVRFAGGVREDKTEVIEIRPPDHVVLRAHVRPFGVTRVVLELEQRGAGTEISLIETLEWPSKPRVLRSIANALLFMRNIQALRRLKRLAEGPSKVRP